MRRLYRVFPIGFAPIMQLSSPRSAYVLPLRSACARVFVLPVSPVWHLHGCMSGFFVSSIPYTSNPQKRLYARLAFVLCSCLPLLVFLLHTLKSWNLPTRNESIERPHKRYTSTQRPFTPLWYTDTTHGQKRDTGRLWGCHGTLAH